MSGKTVYFPHSYAVFGILLFVLLVVVGLLFVGAMGAAFAEVGFSPLVIALILVGTFFGSFINIPLKRLKTTVPLIREDYAGFFGLGFRVPRVEFNEVSTLLAVNVGGAVIPTIVSIYLLANATLETVLYSLLSVFLVTLMAKATSRPVPGIGIATPGFVPPLVAVGVAFCFGHAAPLTVAYVGGVLGTLIGADLLNLGVISKLGAPVASIGGAGAFDGVFLSGIFAVLWAGLAT
ncbi:MAG: DUF1614 domain-containing protein [Candidatus Bathyarchaeia archaeon]